MTAVTCANENPSAWMALCSKSLYNMWSEKTHQIPRFKNGAKTLKVSVGVTLAQTTYGIP